MHENSKPIINCPICETHVAMIDHTHYKCDKCHWNSLENTIDIVYKDPLSGVLSNFFPHRFLFYTCEQDKTNCLSMESFIQSLRVKDATLQKYICNNYSGDIAWKLKFALHDWREEGIVYWNGNEIERDSEEYTVLITTAYDRLFESNPVFRELVLPKFKDKILIHSIGGDNKSETLLTEKEFRYQLNRLINML